LARLIHWLTTKDFQPHHKGRGKRATIAAIVLSIVAVVFFGIIMVSSTVFAKNTAGENSLLLLGAFVGGASIGALIGALSDMW
jgi:hypothetical protein